MSQPKGAGISPDARASRRLVINFIVCLLLLVQYLLGMVVNLFVTIPAHHPGAGASNYFTGAADGLGWVIPDGPVWVAVHAVFGMALVVAAFGSLVTDLRWASRTSAVLSVLGALAILGAAFNGASFLTYGKNINSMIMAGLWALALVCYLGCMFDAARSRVRNSEVAAAEGG
jgi:hypothetical protein